METPFDKYETRLFNEDIITSVVKIKKSLDDLRFTTRNPLIPTAEMDSYIDQISIINQETRRLFVLKARLILQEVLINDIAQHEMLQRQEQKKFQFDRYHTEHLKEEKIAQLGYEFQPTIGFRLANDVDQYGEPVGDILDIRFVAKQNMAIDEQTDPNEIDNLLTNSDEVYIQYTKVDEDNIPHRSVLIRVSLEGIQRFNPDINKEIDDFIDGLRVGDKYDFVDLDIDIAETTADLLGRLASMKIAKYKTVKI